MRRPPTRLRIAVALALAGWCLAVHAAETEESISEKAKAIVGLSEIASVERVTLQEEDTLPFLRRQLTKAPAWRVTFKANHLPSASAGPGEMDAYARSITALFLDETGQLVSVKIVIPFETDPPVPAPPIRTVEAQLAGRAEIYQALPRELPEVNVMQAIGGVRTSGRGTPHLAKEIDVQYVTIRLLGNLPRASWVVSCRGILSLVGKASHSGPPHWPLRDRLRTIVDPATGKCLYATDLPVPEIGSSTNGGAQNGKLE